MKAWIFGVADFPSYASDWNGRTILRRTRSYVHFKALLYPPTSGLFAGVRSRATVVLGHGREKGKCWSVIFRRCIFMVLALLTSWLQAAQSEVSAPVLLISLDGFRWDYCDLYSAETPNLRRLKAEGASARGLIPVFPSNTFPCHYSIATGLRPSHHGIINNRFFDSSTGRYFSYNQPASNHDGSWWGGEPIWITARRQGRASACYFWPGSEAEIGGLRPTFWKPYDYSVAFENRLAELIDWLKLPVQERPAVITFYLEEANSVGHAAGPGSTELGQAIKKLDAQVGAILARAEAEQIALNVVVVSDHGMTALSVERVVILDDYVDLETVQMDFEGPVAGLRPNDGDVAALMTKLAKLPAHVKAYRVEDLPGHLAVTPNLRQPPIWILVDEGWHLQRRSWFKTKQNAYSKGEHGYDPAFKSMQGILIVHGPAFRADGACIEPVESIHVYNLLCAAAGLKPAANDGDERLVRALLVR